MNWGDLTVELAGLQARFKEEEDRAATMVQAPVGTYVIVRADGVKVTKKHLKDVVYNDKFHKAVESANTTTMIMWRDFAPAGHRPYLLGAFAMSDEVSFIVGPGDNYYDRRLWKMATTLGSTLSGAATTSFGERGKGGHQIVVTFDARPLLAPDKAVLVDYIWCRALIGLRNAMNRVVRLSGRVTEAEQFGDLTTRDDFAWLAGKITEHGLEHNLRLACRSCFATGWDGHQQPQHSAVRISSGDRREMLRSIEHLALQRK